GARPGPRVRPAVRNRKVRHSIRASEPGDTMLAFWIAPLLAAAALATEAPAPGALSLAPLLEKVRQDNPDLLALDEERAAALDRAVAAGAFPDPSLGFAVRNLPMPSLSFREDM